MMRRETGRVSSFFSLLARGYIRRAPPTGRDSALKAVLVAKPPKTPLPESNLRRDGGHRARAAGDELWICRAGVSGRIHRSTRVYWKGAEYRALAVAPCSRPAPIRLRWGTRMSEQSAPFVFRNADRLPRPEPSDRGRCYDPERQLWVDSATREAWVLHQARLQQDARSSTRFGETLQTRTAEGIDKSEGVQATEVGETMITRTSERPDEGEAVSASEFGETLITKTSEDPDQSEGLGSFQGSPYRASA